MTIKQAEKLSKKKTQYVTVVIHKNRNSKTTQRYATPNPDFGRNPKEIMNEHNALTAMWCSCKVKGDPVFYRNRHEHGYTCSKCHKILQTG